MQKIKKRCVELSIDLFLQINWELFGGGKKESRVN
jgi:hypothetical protein